MYKQLFLPPAYVVRREGNVLTRVCPSIHPSICLSMEGGVRSESSRGGGGQVRVQLGRGGVRSVQPGGSGQTSRGGGGQVRVQPGGVRSVPAGGGSGQTSRGGGQVRVQPGGGSGQSSRGGGQSSWRGGGGQHLAPSCGRYASCVHAGGLSCYFNFNLIFRTFMSEDLIKGLAEEIDFRS